MAKKFIASSTASVFELLPEEIGVLAFVRIREVEKRNLPRKYESLIKDQAIAEQISNLLGREVPICTETKITILPRDFVYIVKPSTGKFYEVTYDMGGCGDCASDNCYGCCLIGWMHGF